MDTPKSALVVIQPKPKSALVRAARRLLRPANIPGLSSLIKNIKTSWPTLIKVGAVVGVTVSALYVIAAFIEANAIILLGGALAVSLGTLWLVGRFARPAIYAEIAELPNAVRCELAEAKIGRDGIIFLNFKVFSVLPLRVHLPDIEVVGLALNRNDLLVTKSSMLPNKKHVFDGGGPPLVVQLTVHVTLGSWTQFQRTVSNQDFVSVSATVNFGTEHCYFVDRAGHVSGVFPETVPGAPAPVQA